MKSTRDKIEDIIEEFVSGVYDDAVGQREAADAILAALPDMIAPLVWEEFGRFMTRSSSYRISKAPFESHWNLFFGSEFLGHNKDKNALVVIANAHHRAAIMAAFQTPTITP
jgi:hypothetical protein